MNRLSVPTLLVTAKMAVACGGPIPHESKDFSAPAEELTAEECVDRVTTVNDDTKLAVVDMWGNGDTSGVEILTDYAEAPEDLRVFVFYPGTMQEAEAHGSSFTFPTPGEEVTLSATYDCGEWERIADLEGAENFGDHGGQEDLGHGVVDFPVQP